MSESEKIRGIVIHAEDFTVTAGRALDTAAVGLTLKVAGGEERFVLSAEDAQQLGSALKAAADPRSRD
jgi:hypothetical protein